MNGVKIKYSLLVVSIIFTGLTSCKSVHNYAAHNYFNGSVFYNDSLNISGVFFGDIQFFDVKNKKPDIPKNISKNNLLLYGVSTTSPTYEVFLSFERAKENNGIDTTYLKTNDTLNQIVIFSKRKDRKSLHLCLKSTEKFKSNQSMINDAKNIMDSFKFDTSAQEELDYFKIFNTYKEEDNFLHVIEKFDNAPIQNKNDEWTKLQLLLTILSHDPKYHRYKEMVKDFEHPRTKYLKKILDSVDATNKHHTQEHQILDKIKSITANKKVVMLNENHWYPKHRIFATKLLKPLRSNGFKYLAIEAINKGKDSLVNQRYFPTRNTGYYTREPFFGIFIREAIKHGFVILRYDDFSTKNREKTQAENLKKIIDQYPDENIFIYAGIDHILEKDKKKKRMAEYFTELTNIDPLTIDQVELVAESPHKVTLYSAKSFDNIKRINNSVDYFLVNNYREDLTEVYDDSSLSHFVVNDSGLKEYNNNEVLISLYYHHEYEKYKTNSIPFLNRIKRITNNSVAVKIPKGKFQIRISSKDNHLILSKSITNK
ncbi:hypothetical protein [Aquimarina sediminis]|uniref:hypothetical protein n=1 Tax=Aquimarina sediminis TaxID=2070536 RepID=UPI000CA06796|nr:hypothetical protein [Aquimarina sediminis]